MVSGPSKEIHDARLQATLQRLDKHNLVLNREKCSFGQPSIEFLGLIITKEGAVPTSDTTSRASPTIKAPVNTAEVSSFLGMTNYHSKFVSNYSELTEPLRRLLRKGTAWEGSQAQQAAFESLKSRLVQPPVLAHYDPDLPTIVTCDASAVALGAVLSQLHDNGERPVAFASTSLSAAGKKYSAGERESLAFMWACEYWHIFLFGRAFTLRTDHQALTTLLATTGSGHRPLRIYRWSDRLHQYKFSAEYKPGRENSVADALSRLPTKTATSANQRHHIRGREFYP